MTLGQRLKARREELGYSLQDIAHQIDTSKGHLSDIENGKVSQPAFKFICKISKILNVRLDELAKHV